MVNIRATLPGPSTGLREAQAPGRGRIVIGGHYDTKLEHNFTFVGASDGASSAAFLLELARALKGRPNPLPIELLFIDGEEAVVDWNLPKTKDHTYGSRFYVEQLKKTGTVKDVRAFILVDMINGAWGGRDGKDGIEGVTNPSQNMSNLPVETLEARYPLRVEEYALRPDSGGAGRWRGGLGLVRQYRLLADRAVLQLRSDRTWHAPWGLFGGRSGAPSRSLVDRGAGWVPLPGKATLEITAGTVIRHEQAGAGGWGDPAGRDPAAVAADLTDGKISPERAEADYGARA